MEAADPTTLSTEGVVGLAESLELSGRDAGGYVADVLDEIGIVNVGPEGTRETLATLQTEAGVLAELHTGGCLDDFAERIQEGAWIVWQYGMGHDSLGNPAMDRVPTIDEGGLG